MNSKGSASKRTNEQMGLCQTKDLLHSKGKSPDSRDSPQNGRKSLTPTYPIRIEYPESTGNSKSQPPKNQHPDEEMGI
jgi:hypothetical protein